MTASDARLARARRRGFADGVASVLGGVATGRPARVSVRRGLGSLAEDWQMRSATASGWSMGAHDELAAVAGGAAGIAPPASGAAESDPVIGERLAQDRRLTIRSSYAGPLPAPGMLAEYDRILPGLAREIVDQWKAETQHRHETVASMRATDHEEMLTYYAAERRGQTFSIVAILGVLAIAIASIALDRPAVGVTGLLTGGAAAIWAMRRRSSHSDLDAPVQLDAGVPDLSTGERREGG
jgi:uncharacterized membrane protein